MNKSFLTVLILSSVFSIAVLATNYIHDSIFNTPIEKTEIAEPVSTSAYKYRVSVFNGKLAVFEGDSKIPYKVYDTYVDTLPENDVKRLTDGIKINSSSDLMKIIEEYTS